MNSKLKRIMSGVAALAVAGVTPLLMAAPAGAAVLRGPATVKTAGGTADLNAGDSNDTFTLRLPTGAACAADGTQGGRWHTYMIPGTQNPATDLAFAGTGGLVGASVGTAGTGTFRQNLYTTGGVPVRGQAPNLGDAVIINIPNMNYMVWTDGQIPSGTYNIGIACIDLDLASAIDNFWNKVITVTYPGGDNAGPRISWAVGAVPAAPTGVSAAAGNQQCVVSFTPGAADPPATSYTATANPGAFVASGAGSPLTIGGLTNGVAYSVSVTGTNSAGTSASSTSASCTPVAGARTNVTAVSVTPGAPGSGAATVNWTLPGVNSPAATPTGYLVVLSGPTANTATVPHPGTSNGYTALAAGAYNVTVTAQYADAPTSGSNPASAPVSFAVNPNAVLLQDIDVNRPLGKLVITQVCGVYAAQPADPASPGFPAGLPAVANNNSSTVQAPTALGTAPTTGAAPGGPADPLRLDYPYPTDVNGVPQPNYPTHCGIDLGKAKFVTRGPGAGQFFAASGILNQVTVVDTRDDDTGWTVTGTMGTFSANGGTDTFSGSQLGWIPQMTEDTGSFTDSNGASYDQTVLPGSPVAPNTANATGLSSGKTLASAVANVGLGTAILDARLKLLIPITADAGNYTGVLTLTAA